MNTSFQEIPIAQLHESKLNPRKYFDPAALEQLVASIRASGIITPLVVRPNADGFEIGAGHRRYRAAKLAGLEKAPAVVRELDDAAFVELLNIENLQRQDMTPLEEAEGYRLLITKAGYDVARIAERIGMSEKYVYDRVKLLQLIPEAQELLREDKITAGHGILLARLKPEEQKRVLHKDNDSFWRHESVLEGPDGDPLTDPERARSVRELERWIADNVRFKPTETDAFLFPETAREVETAEKIVEITHDSFIQESARTGRTIRDGYWQRADGKEKSKTCERSMTGVIVVGPDRGNAFKVCVNREKCLVHWGKEIREREKRAASGKKTTTTRGTDGAGAEQDRYKREQEKRNRERQRCEAALPAIFKALAEKVKKAPTGARGALGQALLEETRIDEDVPDLLTPGTSAEDLVRYLAFAALTDRPDTWQGLTKFAKELKPFGVDVKGALADVDKALKTAAEAAKKKPAQASARKKT